MWRKSTRTWLLEGSAETAALRDIIEVAGAAAFLAASGYDGTLIIGPRSF